MAYITKNANILLLFLIVLTAIFLVGVALFSTSQINSLTGRYLEKVEKLRDVETDLQGKIRLLDQVKTELKLKQERETSFTQKYSEVRGEKETIEQEKDRLATEKQQALNSLAQSQNELVEARNRINFNEAQIQQLNQRGSQLESDLRSSQALAKERLSTINSLTSQLNTCKSNSQAGS
ncbi:MAG: hypothetical protein AABX52_04845 [Nanoarchaeota archaeon]